ncbi:heat shock protein SSQ1 [Striga asiatica]|uniref:Heat shock protein SSQ1 n=1 Tax=Striga asiatica TaxID=4170 RepID=A0A5A7PVY2_STRAF|nr:heat shock protein SSQ1 [Striga asiatica]
MDVKEDVAEQDSFQQKQMDPKPKTDKLTLTPMSSGYPKIRPKGIPKTAGWMLLTTMQKASNGVRSFTTPLTSKLSENKEGYSSWKIRSKMETKRPIKKADITITTTENFAVLG